MMNNRLFESVTESYPEPAKNKLLEIHKLIVSLVQANDLQELQLSLKWGELSYSVKGGSPIRIDYKEKQPDKCFIFFNCNSKLVDSFREVYGSVLTFQGNRAIALSLLTPLPIAELKSCLLIALQYHQVKHLPLLGL